MCLSKILFKYRCEETRHLVSYQFEQPSLHQMSRFFTSVLEENLGDVSQQVGMVPDCFETTSMISLSHVRGVSVVSVSARLDLNPAALKTLLGVTSHQTLGEESLSKAETGRSEAVDKYSLKISSLSVGTSSWMVSTA